MAKINLTSHRRGASAIEQCLALLLIASLGTACGVVVVEFGSPIIPVLQRLWVHIGLLSVVVAAIPLGLVVVGINCGLRAASAGAGVPAWVLIAEFWGMMASVLIPGFVLLPISLLVAWIVWLARN